MTDGAALADFKCALDHAAIVATTDVAGRITYANDKFCEISGYSREELIGQDHRIVNSGHHPKELIRDLWVTIANGRVWHGELRNRAKDGRLYWVDTTIVPFLKPDGKPYQYIAIRADITARKAAEERLADQAALARVGQIAAMVAHEVRNPLAGIKGAMQILISRRKPGDAELQVMQDITARIDALSELINDLMLYARPRPLQLGAVDLRRLADEATAFLRRDPALQPLEIAIEGADASLNADGELLRATVLNLLLNAAQAMSGRGRITIALGATGADVSIEVRDTGPGIPPEIRERVFEPFFTTKSRGGGLGLAIAKRTAERHGGSLQLICPDEGGTVARLTLPAGPSVTARPSNHVEPRGPLATARHYIRDLVYGASDGIVTTFAVVSGVAGGALSPTAVLIVGAANLAADGLSMGVGNFLSIRAHERARAAENLPEEEAFPSKHGLATFAAFVIAGSVPLLPYLVRLDAGDAVWWSVAPDAFDHVRAGSGARVRDRRDLVEGGAGVADHGERRRGGRIWRRRRRGVAGRGRPARLKRSRLNGRARQAAITSRSICCTSKGFSTTSKAPRALAPAASSGVPCAVIMTTALDGVLRRIAARSDRSLESGRRRSSTTASIGSGASSTTRSAVAASGASSTVCPAAVSASATAQRINVSSSTISTRRGTRLATGSQSRCRNSIPAGTMTSAQAPLSSTRKIFLGYA